jgi:serine/threonine protein kinase
MHVLRREFDMIGLVRRILLSRRASTLRPPSRPGTGTVLFEGEWEGRRVMFKTAGERRARASITREWDALGRVDHKNILPLLDVVYGSNVSNGRRDHKEGSGNGGPRLVFPFVAGGSLDARLRGLHAATGIEQRVRLLQQISSAVASLERRRILHRDLKASNVLLDDGGQGDGGVLTPYLCDFGIATPLGRSGGEPVPIKGSPHHMAPEVLRAQRAGAESCPYGIAQEMYSFAVLAYEVVEMKSPYVGIVGGLPGTITRDELARRIVEDGFRPAFADVVDEAKGEEHFTSSVKLEQNLRCNIVRLVERCWAQSPQERPRTFADVEGEIERLLQPFNNDSNAAVDSNKGITTPVRIGYATDIGTRSRMEDAVVDYCMDHGRGHTHIVGVFDGHNGDHIAALAKYIVKDTLDSIVAHASTGTTNNDACVLLSQLFENFERGLSDREDAARTGTTATVGVVQQNGTSTDLCIGWVGDSRAIVFDIPQRHHQDDGDDGIEAEVLLCTTNHAPSEESERVRIESLGGVVDRLKKTRDDGFEMPYGPQRVYAGDGTSGGLAVSRALGNTQWRPWISSDHETLVLSWSNDTGGGGGGTTRVLVLATDGLWDVTTDAELFAVVQSFVAKGPSAVADALVRRAVDDKQTQDNCAVVVCVL